MPDDTKSGVGNAEGDDSQLSGGQKLFKGAVPTAAPPSKIDLLLQKGAQVGRARIDDANMRRDAEGEQFENAFGGHHRVPMRYHK